MHHRVEINGLRALAVVSVIAFHLFPDLLPGGFVGVDAFFVISGFLIAQLIARGIVEGRFSLVGFYRNRMRRLFPAMALVTATTLGLGYVWLLPSDYESAAKASGAALAFVSNVFFASQSGYFAPTVAHNPMLHTWSLAVEEQFYLVFPFVMLALVPRGKWWCVALLVVLGGVSFWWAITTNQSSPSVAFYGLHTRAWEMIVGALAGLALVSPALRLGAGLRDTLAWTGLVGLVSSFWLVSPASAHPGWITLLPVLSTALVLLCATTGTSAARVLSWGPAVYVGLVSYSLYLWHQPAIVFGSLHLDGAMTWWMAAVIALVSLILADATTRWVEAPFRHGAWRAKLTFVRFASATCVLVIGAFVIVVSDGAKGRVPQDVLVASAPHDSIYYALQACHVNNVDVAEREHSCVIGSGSKPTIAVWGDSHAHSLTAGLVQVLPNVAIDQASVSGCPPTTRFTNVLTPEVCEEGQGKARARIMAPDGPGVVVFAARWAQSANPGPMDNREGGREPPLVYPFGPRDRSQPSGFEGVRAGLFEDYAQAVRDALAADRTVVLVYGVPEMGWHVPSEVQRRAWRDGARAVPVSVSRSLVDARNAYPNVALDGLGEHPNLLRVYPQEVLCKDDRCLGQRDGRTLYTDDDHLNDVGAALVAQQVVDALVAHGEGPLLNGPVDAQAVVGDRGIRATTLEAVAKALRVAQAPR